MPTLPLTASDNGSETTEGQNHPSTTYTPATYTATLTAPLFYSSYEGRMIETHTIIAATALMHAIGYNHPSIELAKRYLERGDDTTQPTYDHLAEIDLFASDMTPIDISTSEKTYRSVGYSTEYRVTTDDQNVVSDQLDIDATKGCPGIMGKSTAGWHRVRKYTGITPGSEYRFTVWTPDTVDMPSTLRFEMGISRTGEFTCTRQETPAETISLNEFLLSSVYDTPVDPATILTHAEDYKRGNDPRLTHYTGVERDWVDDVLFSL